MSWIRKPTELELELILLGFECVKALAAVSCPPSLSHPCPSPLVLFCPGLAPPFLFPPATFHVILLKHSLGITCQKTGPLRFRGLLSKSCTCHATLTMYHHHPGLYQKVYINSRYSQSTFPILVSPLHPPSPSPSTRRMGESCAPRLVWRTRESSHVM